MLVVIDIHAVVMIGVGKKIFIRIPSKTLPIAEIIPLSLYTFGKSILVHLINPSYEL